MYELDIKPEVDKIFSKLAKKNPKQLRIVDKKIKEIMLKPEHEYKNLRSPLHMFKRVHIDQHFVLVFRIRYEEELVVIYYYDHHDNVYQWRPKPE